MPRLVTTASAVAENCKRTAVFGPYTHEGRDCAVCSSWLWRRIETGAQPTCDSSGRSAQCPKPSVNVSVLVDLRQKASPAQATCLTSPSRLDREIRRWWD